MKVSVFGVSGFVGINVVSALQNTIIEISLLRLMV